MRKGGIYEKDQNPQHCSGHLYRGDRSLCKGPSGAGRRAEGGNRGLVELESRIVEGGSESIECFYDSALAAPYILKLVQQGEKDGFDAIVLDCFLDPALSECRELVRIPVMGACQSSCSLAARMAGRFSVIGILDNADRCIRENIRCYCFERQLASIPVIHMPVVELHNSEEALVDKAAAAANQAVRQDAPGR